MANPPEAPKSIEVPDAPVAPEAPLKLSDLAESGLSAQEIEMAKKQGLAGEEGNGDKSNDRRGGSSAGADGGGSPGDDKKGGESDAEKKKGEEAKKTVDERWRVLSEGKSPEAVIQEIGEKGDLSPEQEKVLLASLTQNGKTLYWSQKKARKRANEVETREKDKDDRLAKAEARVKELEENNKKKSAGEEDPLNLDGEEGGEEGKTDPNKKPLTREDLDKIEKEKNTQADLRAKEHAVRVSELSKALDQQQGEAKERYADFDEALDGVKEILIAANAGELTEMFPDSRERSKIEREAKALLYAYAHADEFESEQFNAADMTYELGKKFPQFGKKPPKKDLPNKASGAGETDADGDPENTRRAIANANRRGSSAALNGGGSRSVNLEELTHEQAARLSDAQWAKLPKETRQRLLRPA